MPKSTTLEVHTSRKLAKRAAKALKRAGRTKRLRVKRAGDLHLIEGVENKDWRESTAAAEYPRRLRFPLGEFKARKQAIKAILKARKKHKAHYQLVREEERWILATFDHEAYRLMCSKASSSPPLVRGDEYHYASGDQDKSRMDMVDD